MQYLEIMNFSSVTKARVDINRFNILIGPQASGKSVIAKTLSFFKEFMSLYYFYFVTEELNKRESDKEYLKKFEKVFPKYTWEMQEFTLEYRTDCFFIKLWSEKINTKSVLRLDYSPEILILLKKIRLASVKEIELKKSKKSTPRRFDHEQFMIQRKYEDLYYSNEIMKDISTNSVFIPAARSFFANLQKNIFTFLASNIEIDPFMKSFGSLYESVKGFYGADFYEPEKQEIVERISKISRTILKGEYVYKDDKDWIKSRNRQINLANASSGQQESLPLLIVLGCMPFLHFEQKRACFFLEEPEAHLFPLSQKSIITILSIIYKHTLHDIVITTHSPYILSAVNILTAASQVLGDGNGEDVKRIIGDAEPIHFSDVSAYSVDRGVVESILDHDANMVGVSVIDQVSDSFNSDLDKLLVLGA